MEMKLRMIGIVLLCGVSLSGHAATDPVRETKAVCSNLDMYVDIALKSRGDGIPKNMGLRVVAASINEHFKSSRTDTDAFIAVVKDIHKQVYEDPTIDRARGKDVIVSACSKYKGFDVDENAIAAHLDRHPRSAWDPIKRVPLCVKMGQTASNIALARDKGTPKEAVAEMVKTALADDRLTLERAPQMIEEVFGNPEIEVPPFFAYNLSRCEAVEAGGSYRELGEFKSDILACQRKGTLEAKAQCQQAVFGL